MCVCVCVRERESCCCCCVFNCLCFFLSFIWELGGGGGGLFVNRLKPCLTVLYLPPPVMLGPCEFGFSVVTIHVRIVSVIALHFKGSEEKTK